MLDLFRTVDSSLLLLIKQKRKQNKQYYKLDITHLTVI